MNELSIKEKAKRYDEAIEKAKQLSKELTVDDIVEQIFPELKESEDERARKAIIKHFKVGTDYITFSGFSKEQILAWLEKQGEQKPIDKIDSSKIKKDPNPYWTLASEYQLANKQKPTDKVEPKFKVGDWVICCDYKPIQIINIKHRMYYWSNGDIRPIEMVDSNSNIHLWTIQDAKKGDILQANKCALIFDSLAKDIDGNTVISSWYHCNTKTFYGMGTCKPDLWVIEGVTPATKEQRDLLFQKMKEAGYEWDAEKKELKKIEAKPAWSEKDEKVLHAIRNALNYEKPRNYLKSRDFEFTDILDWLKFLKDRVHPKKEWSKEDEGILACIIGHLSTCLNEEAYKKYRSWLKSLKDRYA